MAKKFFDLQYIDHSFLSFGKFENSEICTNWSYISWKICKIDEIGHQFQEIFYRKRNPATLEMIAIYVF